MKESDMSTKELLFESNASAKNMQTAAVAKIILDIFGTTAPGPITQRQLIEVANRVYQAAYLDAMGVAAVTNVANDDGFISGDAIAFDLPKD
jgi:hypothetical protein